MIEKMHIQVKTALHSINSGGASPWIGGRIYDTVGVADAITPFMVWRFSAVEVVSYYGNDEEVVATVQVTTCTDWTAGTEYHLELIDDLSTLRDYKAVVGTEIDRLTMRLISIGDIRLEENLLVSDTILEAKATRI